MKGQSSLTEEIGGTIIVLVFVLAIALISVSYSGISPIKGASPAAYSLEFVNFATKPFLLSHTLSFYNIDDRQFFEQALQSAVTGSVENASASKMPEGLRSLVDMYNFNMYFIEIKNGRSSALALDNQLRGCGTDDDGNKLPDGVCVSKGHQDYGKCSLGRDEIPDADNSCGFWQTCCKEVSRPTEEHDGRTIEITRCGPSDAGVCSAGIASSTMSRLPLCPDGRVYYPDNSCRDSNPNPDYINLIVTDVGQKSLTPICCVPVRPGSLSASGFSSTAQTPLLFNRTRHYGGGGALEVTIG
ncbi:MAG: hypothetical protein HYW27_04150 [Candidatus Aenigmarchaeota archaeon]|nr:hypothetical protein [Candidatus Aenigmarchaeota archaeon]